MILKRKNSTVNWKVFVGSACHYVIFHRLGDRGIVHRCCWLSGNKPPGGTQLDKNLTQVSSIWPADRVPTCWQSSLIESLVLFHGFSSSEILRNPPAGNKSPWSGRFNMDTIRQVYTENFHLSGLLDPLLSILPLTWGPGKYPILRDIKKYSYFKLSRLR